MSISFSNF